MLYFQPSKMKLVKGYKTIRMYSKYMGIRYSNIYRSVIHGPNPFNPGLGGLAVRRSLIQVIHHHVKWIIL